MKADLAQDATTTQRNIGLIGATMIGVGAIVGGGVLALAGTAFASAGPAALVAFALNGVIAFMTARSFASMASAFPQSGGSYNFAKMVLTVRAAFAVGWVVWFASIVAQRAASATACLPLIEDDITQFAAGWNPNGNPNAPNCALGF